MDAVTIRYTGVRPGDLPEFLELWRQGPSRRRLDVRGRGRHKGETLKFLAVEGRIGDAIKQIDWDAHPLGPARQWSPALKSSIYTLLNSASPKVLLWGAQLITFFNDACSALVQERGVRGLGLPYPDFRPGLWPRLRGSIEAAMRGEGSIVQEFRTLR